VDPEFAADWDAVRRAQQENPGGEQVKVAADQLLARNPPLNLRVAAVQAKAGYAYSHGQDPQVVRFADEILAAVDDAGGLEATESQLLLNLRRLRALALARSGDPARGLVELNTLAAEEAIPERELVVAQAMAYDRAGKLAEATVAFARWRALAPEGSADAEYARLRISTLAARLTPSELESLARRVSGTPAADCLLAYAGQDLASTGTPVAWVTRECVRAGTGRHIGILLPRTGKYAGLSDTQFAAAIAAVRVLEATAESGLSVIWADSGSTPQQAQKAAEELLKNGAKVLVGPVGSKNVRAVATEVKGQAQVVIPGEGAGTAVGVAPSLEARGRALVTYANDRKYTEVVVLGPPSGYTRRVVSGLQARAAKLGMTVTTIDYEPNQTSFRAVLAPVIGRIRKRAAVVVVDRIRRAELVFRQLVRDGVKPSSGALVLTTGEGVGGEVLAQTNGVFEGVVMAPAAWPDPEGGAFADYYREQEGTEPDDQAWLVWSALTRAWRGNAGDAPPVARLVRVEGGRLVLEPSQEQLTVRPPG